MNRRQLLKLAAFAAASAIFGGCESKVGNLNFNDVSDIREGTDILGENDSREDVKDSSQEYALPPDRSQSVSNGKRVLSDDDITAIKRVVDEGIENPKPITEIPEAILNLLNVAVYNVYGRDIPEEVRLQFSTEDEFKQYFGDASAYYVYINNTIYLRDTITSWYGVLASFTHEVGHGLDNLVYFPNSKKAHREHGAWFSHIALLVEMESLLPLMGRYPVVSLETVDGYQMDQFFVVMYPITETFSPFFGLYGTGALVKSIWQYEDRIQAYIRGDGPELDGNTLGIMAAWCLFQEYGWEGTRGYITSHDATEINDIVLSERSPREFYNLVNRGITAIFGKILYGPNGYKPIYAWDSSTRYSKEVSITKVLKYLFDIVNRINAEERGAIFEKPAACTEYSLENIESGCYT
ncbi:MAG: hypothetical protein PHU63_04330 [Candidatus ainarchaeum sp.]|nr:hypothetical protein [Candidatus ainarchaeum sp.]